MFFISKMTKLLFYFIFICSFNFTYAGYSRTYYDANTWKKIQPYLLPEDHPVKPVLDEIFSSSRVIRDENTMEEAGFIEPHIRAFSHLVIGKHPDIKGYIIKTYLDVQTECNRGLPEHELWIERIKGSILIRDTIKTHIWEKIFKVPKKWIYILPDSPSPPFGFYRKNSILVEEDMDLCSHKRNEEIWNSEIVNRKLLKKFYYLITEVGLVDCAKPCNAPFSNDGKIAFIDTESFNEWPIRYKSLIKHLTPEMQVYWQKLILKKKKF